MARSGAAAIIARGIELGASDIHLTVNQPPVYRVNGRLINAPGDEALQPEDTRRLGAEMMPDSRLAGTVEEYGQVDFANTFPGLGRFRVNLYIQRGFHAAAIRLIPADIPDINNLGLPGVISDLALKERGLLVITGPAGSGKSTTLAAMINFLNQTRNGIIITLEDPIEYWHQHEACLINQREVGTDTPSFAHGLRAALRQDPDVIMVGEMRDIETISTVMTAAETGHLILTSLHSASAVQTVERIVDVFPPHQQPQIRVQLASTLRGIICQQLLPGADGNSRVAACEVLVATPAIGNLIRENKLHQIYSALQTGGSAGMITMEKSLKMLYEQGKITWDEYHKSAMC